MRTFLMTASATLLSAFGGWLCYGWIGVIAGLFLLGMITTLAIVLNVFAILLDCLVNPIGRGREYTFRYPTEGGRGQTSTDNDLM